jgi:deoxyribonuclease V
VWPTSVEELIRIQESLGEATQPLWRPSGSDIALAGCFVCFESPRDGRAEPAWAGAALLRAGRPALNVVVEGEATSPYQPGLLAIREGRLLEAAVRGLPEPPDVLLVNATGRDHPRRAGLALHLGAVLDLPTIGVTERPLLAEGSPPGPRRGDTSPLVIEELVVAAWLRTRSRVRPVVVHPGWRTDLETAVELVLTSARNARTPEPIRQSRRAARAARGAARR